MNLDNGSIHKSKKVQKFISNNDWVELYFLPPYSPKYNPIERFWLWLKNKVYGCRSFSSTSEMIAKVRKLIWHYHESNLISNITINYEHYKCLLWYFADTSYRAITILNKGELHGYSEIKMEIWNQYTRLIASIILYYNSYIINQLYLKAGKEEKEYLVGIAPSG